jgi:hypothetical protein
VFDEFSLAWPASRAMTDARGISGDARTKKEMKRAVKTLELLNRGLGVNDFIWQTSFLGKEVLAGALFARESGDNESGRFIATDWLKVGTPEARCQLTLRGGLSKFI